jgi:hypothetical protein
MPAHCDSSSRHASRLRKLAITARNVTKKKARGGISGFTGFELETVAKSALLCAFDDGGHALSAAYAKADERVAATRAL